ncbi:MAG: hypothetical protein CM15mP120_01820 [Pseudomonadota bacterium]|nr:MAG: hypothetical protein CM15mP120_01820 [Pseudomonadota bacterium]
MGWLGYRVRNWRRCIPSCRRIAAGRPYRPVISEAMPVHPADAAHAGFGLALDYLTGSCRDEIIERPAEKTLIGQHRE